MKPAVPRSRSRPEPTRPPPLRVASADIERETARSTAALLTAAAYGPLNAWCFVGPANCGAGLFARVALRAHQAIGEYGGPRLPARLHTRGEFVLQIPGTETLIDAAGENAPWGRTEPDFPAVYANHSSLPVLLAAMHGAVRWALASTMRCAT